MDLLSHLGLGLQAAVAPANLACLVLGVLLGTLVGLLPRLGPVAAAALAMPALKSLELTPALILLAGLYYGAQYSGSTGAILLSEAGQPASEVTTIDGHQMARQGRAGVALATAALGSFVAGCLGTLLLALVASPLATTAFRFGPHEYAALTVLGLACVAVLSSGSLLKAMAMIVLGLLFGQVGTEALTGEARFTFARAELGHGIGFGVLALGLFAVGEVIANLGRPQAARAPVVARVELMRPTRQDLAAAWPAVLRGTLLGAVTGLLPGGGAMLASYGSYALEKSSARAPVVPFGRGAIEGVAGPESANNAAAQAAFVPLLTLGLPPNGVMALIAAAMLAHGVTPGPQVMIARPATFWGLVASMWLGNLLLLVLNLPMVNLWLRVLALPYRALFPAVVAFAALGAYALGLQPFDLLLCAAFALLGYAFHKLGCETAPLLLGFVLGPMLEEQLRRALLQSQGDWSGFLTRPLTAGLLLVAALLPFATLLPSLRRRRDLAIHVNPTSP